MELVRAPSEHEVGAWMVPLVGVLLSMVHTVERLCTTSQEKTAEIAQFNDRLLHLQLVVQKMLESLGARCNALPNLNRVLDVFTKTVLPQQLGNLEGVALTPWKCYGSLMQAPCWAAAAQHRCLVLRNLAGDANVALIGDIHRASVTLNNIDLNCEGLAECRQEVDQVHQLLLDALDALYAQ